MPYIAFGATQDFEMKSLGNRRYNYRVSYTEKYPLFVADTLFAASLIAIFSFFLAKRTWFSLSSMLFS